MKKRSVRPETKPTRKQNVVRPKHNVQNLGLQCLDRVVYDEDFHPDDFLSHCREGALATEICVMWGIATSTLRTWAARYPAMAKSYRMGKEAHESFWTTRVRKNILKQDNQKSPYGALRLKPFIWYSKNVLGWSDTGKNDFQGADADGYSFTNTRTGKTVDARGNDITKKDDE